MSKAQELKSLRRGINGNSLHREFRHTDNFFDMDSYYDNFMSPQEIEHAVAEYGDNFDKVHDEFKVKTKLQSFDYPFLFTAVMLQCIRQYILTPFAERENANTGSKLMSEKYGDTGKMSGRYYYAPKKTIIGQKSVPFDIVSGSKKFNLGGINKGLSGNSHRFRTLGHDPILGYVFGTANIMTNTMTMFNGASYHIKYSPNAGGIAVPTIYANANTGKIFSSVCSRVRSDDGLQILVSSVVKEHLHLKSDITTDGLPLPFLSSISPELTQSLAEHGLDAIRLGEIGKQATLAIVINAIISIVHGLLCSINGQKDRNSYKIRTRKILLYSNLIASTSNIIYCAISEDLKKLDLGGMLVSLYRLYSDPKFIDKLKYEYINNELSEIYQKRYSEFSFYYED